MSFDNSTHITSTPNQPGSPPDPAPGLPPVVPPSGRHIVQMFVVPGLIVVVAVTILLGAQWFIGHESAPAEMVKSLENENAEVRWRAANDLTQRLKRDEELASNPQLALRLAELLRKRLDEYDAAARRLAEQGSSQNDSSKKELKEKRKDVQFLIACVGNLLLPAGSELLCEVVRRQGSNDDKGRILLRREAVWSLSNLGNNLQRLTKLSADRRAEIIEDLQAEAAAKENTERRRWAGRTLEYVQAIQDERQPDSQGVIAALAAAADEDDEDSDAFLRELVAHAFNFWHGDEAEEKQIEASLTRLSMDSGRGKVIEIGEDD